MSKRLKTTLLWGRPLLTVGLSLCSLVLLAFLLLTQIYGVSFQNWRKSKLQLREVTSQITAVEEVALESGGKQRVVKAPIKINDTLLEVRGFGPRVASSEVGQSVTLKIPEKNPELSWIDGYWREPTTLGNLLRLTLYFCLPGFFFVVWSLLDSRNRILLLKQGSEQKIEVLKTLPLPRPLADFRLLRAKYSEGSFWSLQSKEKMEDKQALVHGSRVKLISRIATEIREENGELEATWWGQNPLFYLNRTLSVFVGLLIVLFFLV